MFFFSLIAFMSYFKSDIYRKYFSLKFEIIFIHNLKKVEM